jgi:hypothetical protein
MGEAKEVQEACGLCRKFFPERAKFDTAGAPA